MKKRILIMVVIFYYLQGCNGKYSKGPGACSYWYDFSPLSIKCPHGETVKLVCNVYALKESLVDVRWHFTVKKSNELSKKTLITSTRDYSLKNQSPYHYSSSNNSLLIGLSYTVSTLEITAFTEKQTGYYWCQMAIDNVLLEPSEPATLTIRGDVRTGFTTTDMIAISQLKCADPRIRPVVKRENVLTPTTMRDVRGSLTKNSTSSALSPNSTSGGPCTAGGVSCFVYVGVAIGIVVCVCLGIVIATTVYIVCRRRRNNREHSSECDDDDDYYSYGELSQYTEAQGFELGTQTPGRGEEIYRSLSLGGMDYTDMYSRITPTIGRETTATDFGAPVVEEEHVYAVPGQNPLRNKSVVATTERGGQVYTAINPNRFEPSNQYIQLHSQHQRK